MNRVVIRFRDGRLLKGVTGDFYPNKERFHVTPPGPNAKPLEVVTADLKAVFFVKDLAGDPRHREVKKFVADKPAVGRKIQVTFVDGEVLVGTTQGYQPGRPGFFIVPADGQSNNERCYVVSAATRSVAFV